MTDILKSFFGTKNEDIEYEECEHAGDVRALVIAEKFYARKEDAIVEKSIKGKFAYYYKKTETPRQVMLMIILVLFIMQKPHWCEELGEDMNGDCNSDITGEINYYLINTTFINPRVSFIVCFGLMYFLLVMQVIKVQCSVNVKSIEVVKMYLQLGIFSFSLIFTMLETFNFIEKSDLSNLLKMLFILANYKSVLRAMIRVGKMIYRCKDVLFLQFVNLFVFAIISRVIFDGVDELGQDGITYMYSFTSLWRSLDTMFITLLLENFPDILLDSYQINYLYVLYFFIFIILSAIIIFSIVVGVFYFHYQSFFVENINFVATEYPYFTESITPLIEKKFLDASHMESVIETMVKRDAGEVIDEDRKVIRDRAVAKFRRAVNKIIYMSKFGGGKMKEDDKLKIHYQVIKNNFFYKFCNLAFSIYLVLVPCFVLDRSSINLVIDYFQTTEIIAILFMIDFYFKYRFRLDNKFWNFPNSVEFLSNLGIVIFSNALYLLKSDYRDDDILGSYPLFLVWATFCFLKFIKIHVIMMGLVDYRIIIKTCFDVFPIVFDLFKIYTLVMILYATAGLFLFGGVMNTEFLDKFEEITGDELDEGTLLFNFNDMVNSLLFFFNMNMSGYMGNIQIGLIAYRSQNESNFKFLMVKFFFYSYLIITEFILLNVIVGFICEFIGMYQGNTEDEKEKETEIQRNQTIIDLMLDKDRMDDDERSDIVDNYDPPGGKIEEEAEGEDEEENKDMIEKDSIEDDSLLKELSENSVDLDNQV